MDVLSILNGAFAFCGVAGGIVAFLSAHKSGVTKIQADTITALRERVDIIEKELKDQKEENTRLKQIIETIQSALSKRGIHVTIDGEMVFITENNTSTAIKPRRASSIKPKTHHEEDK